MTTKDAINQLMPFVRKVTGKTADKAVRDVARALESALRETNIDVAQYINDYHADKIIDPSCLLKNVDDWHQYIVQDKYVDLCNVLFEHRPVGLGTPNAMVGEGELMFLFGSPQVGISKEKNKGDLTVSDKTVELKGYEFRVFSAITGVDLQSKIAPIAKKYGIKPNQVNGGRTAYEPWGIKKKQEHWNSEFSRVGMDATKKFLLEVLKSISASFTEDDVVKTFDDGLFNAETLQKEMAKKFFLDTPNEWDAFTVLTDTKIMTITADPHEFARMIDNGTLYISGDYMRSFQDIKCGFYLRFTDSATENELFHF